MPKQTVAQCASEIEGLKSQLTDIHALLAAMQPEPKGKEGEGGGEDPEKALSQVFRAGVNLISCGAHSDASQVVAGIVVVVGVVVDTEHVGLHKSTSVTLAPFEDLISYL